MNIKLSFPYTLLDRILSEFILVRESKFKIFIYSILPLFGIAYLVFMLWHDQALSVHVWLPALGLIFINPLATILGVCIKYLNKAVREPFTYSFDENGIHIFAVTHEFTHKWAAIQRVKLTRSRLLFFIAPGAAHCIPVSAVRQAGVLDALLTLAREKGVKVMANTARP